MSTVFIAKSEVLLTENFHLFAKRKKVVVFVPVSHAENLIIGLSKAGAGFIGNYSMCSFRVKGTGTFVPGKKARPFSGKKNQFSSEEEFRLEMECSDESLNSVIDALLQVHPYEEVVYEVYEFMKRLQEIAGTVVRLKKPMEFRNILARLNKSIESDNELSTKFRSVVFTNKKFSAELISSAVLTGCDLVIREFSKPQKFELLITKK